MIFLYCIIPFFQTASLPMDVVMLVFSIIIIKTTINPKKYLFQQYLKQKGSLSDFLDVSIIIL